MGLRLILITSHLDDLEKIETLLPKEELIHFLSTRDGLEYLLDAPEQRIDLLIIEKTGESNILLKYLSSIKNPTPLIYLSEETSIPGIPENTHFMGVVTRCDISSHLPHFLDPEKLKQARLGSPQQKPTKKTLPLPDSSEVPFERPKIFYQRVDLQLLQRLERINFDLFLQLSEDKYIKVFKEGLKTPFKEVSTYALKKNRTHLHIRFEDLPRLLQLIHQHGESTLSNIATQSPEQLRMVIKSTQEAVLGISHSFGISPLLMDVAKTNVKLALKTIGKDPKLFQFLETLTKEEFKDLRIKGFVLAHIACSLAHQLSWSSDYTFQILTTAALFHDIGLENGLQFLTLSIPPYAEIQNLPQERQRSFYQHPIDGFKLIQHFVQSLPGVSILITQHHEEPDGTGFPNRVKGHEFSPLSALFSMSNRLVTYLMRRPAGSATLGLGPFLALHKNHYSQGHFKTVYLAIKGNLNLLPSEFAGQEPTPPPSTPNVSYRDPTSPPSEVPDATTEPANKSA